jgi:hypothetical protein
MTACPTCGHGSRFTSLVELAAQMIPAGDRVPSRQTLRNRGRRIAADLGVEIIMCDGIPFVATADLDRAARIGVPA